MSNDASLPAFVVLKAKQRRLRDGFPEHLGLRVHRAISWLQPAERAARAEDFDTAFVSYWIAFNAAYVQRADIQRAFRERTVFDWYFDLIVSLDARRTIYNAIWDRFPSSIRMVVDNRYLFEPFWRFQNGEQGFSKWHLQLRRSIARTNTALADQDTAAILAIVFERLYVLRNQLIHGGATWNGGVNRDQVRDGGAIMAFLVPQFIDLMMDHAGEDWGLPPYPVID